MHVNESWIWSLTLEGKMKIKFRQQPLGGEVVGGDGLFTLYSCIMCIHYLLKSYSYIYSGPSSLQKDKLIWRKVLSKAPQGMHGAPWWRSSDLASPSHFPEGRKLCDQACARNFMPQTEVPFRMIRSNRT